MEQDISVKEKEDIKINSEINNIGHNLDIENRQKLMNVFAWLIQEDKKQNPLLYQTTKGEM
jgi:hypothetical protein